MNVEAKVKTLGAELAQEVKRASVWYIVLGAVMIFVGAVAVARPMMAGLALTVIVGWVLILAGAMQLVHCFMARSGGGFLFRIGLAALYMVGGYGILTNLFEGMAALTVVLGIVLFVGGTLRIMLGLAMSGVPGVGMLMFSGILSIVLAILIWMRLPSSSEFIIGLFVGIDFIMGGWSMIGLAMKARVIGAIVADQ
jgi:uncharacterized membrane protein HdeD (DUF308 family)